MAYGIPRSDLLIMNPRARVTFVLLVLAAAGLAASQRRLSENPPPRLETFDVMEKTILELQDAMQRGAVTSAGLVDVYLARIAAYDTRGPALSAIIALNPRAKDEAAALDAERSAKGPRGPLHGIPLVVKDNFDMVELPTTAGSLALAGLRPHRDAFQVKRLREGGAVIIGKTNLHELASGITTVSSLGGQTRNPYDPERNPGGSSGGTGAAVAANFAAAGLGTDTCGSIRIPASHNALVGLRPSLGLSSRAGVLPLSHSQDVAGPLARTIADLAVVLDATVGADPDDPATTAAEGRIPKSYRDALRADALKGARIGVLTSLFGTAPEDNEGGGVVRRALETIKMLGAETVDVTVPGLDELLRGSSVIDAEFKFDLADYLAAIPDAPVRSLGEIVERGLHHSAIDASVRRRNAVTERETDAYRRARIKRETLRQAIGAAMDEHELAALAYPTMRRKPAVVGQPQGGSTCQLSASTGLPALSVPAGYTSDGLPIGLELLGRAFDEPRLLALAYAYEQAARVRRPPFSTPPLAGRAAPAPVAFTASAGDARPVALTVRFTYDITIAQLRYDARTAGVSAEEVLGAWIHEGAAGPAQIQLLAHDETARAGSITLSYQQRALLRDGRLYVALHTRRAGVQRAQLKPEM
jgi:Asp-tRNA(Asn)/Glu-tRNA(Gln) amidotransferase A subunit family amidase